MLPVIALKVAGTNHKGLMNVIGSWYVTGPPTMYESCIGVELL